jgi:hypothetical protein
MIVAHHLVPVYSHLISASGSYNHAHTLLVAIGLIFTKSAGSSLAGTELYYTKLFVAIGLIFTKSAGS